MYKLVDTFNGWEGKERYATFVDAETALNRERKAFKSRPENMNSSFCKEIVPADMQWSYHHSLHSYLWQ